MTEAERQPAERPSSVRRRHFRRVALALGALLLAGLVVLGSLLAWLVATPSGLQFALSQARPYLPDGTRIESAEGRLIGPLRIEGLQVATPTASVAAERIELDWHPRALLGGILRVRRLAGEGVSVRVVEAEPAVESESTALPTLPADLAPPLAVVVESLAVAPIELTLADGTRHRIDRVELGARADAEGLALESLQVRAPAGRIDARLRVGASAPHPVAGRIEWRWAAGEPVPALAGDGRLHGTVADLRIDHELTAPTPVTVRAALRLFREEPQWRARIDMPSNRPAEWLADAPPLSLGLGIDLEGTFERVSASGGFDLGDVPGGPYRGRLDLTADLQGLAIERLALRPAGEAAGERRVSVEGRVRYAEAEPRFDLTVDWKDLQWPLQGVPTAHSPTGRITVEGTTESYRIDGQIAAAPVDARPAAPADIQLTGRGSTTGLEQLRARVDWAEAALDLDGRVRWAAPGEAHLEAELTGLDPARFGATVAGELGAALVADIGWSDAGVRAEAELRYLRGDLGGYPVDGTARALYADDTLEIPGVRLAAGDARLTVSGRAGDRLSIDWSVDIPDLKALAGSGAGQLSGEGRVVGPRNTPVIRGTLEGQGLEWQTVRIGRFVLDADAVLALERDSRIDLRVSDLSMGEERMEEIRAELRGSSGKHALTVEARGPRGALDIALDGGLDGADWSGQLTALRLQPAGREPWTLARAAGLRWIDGRGTLERACLARGAERLCASGAGRPVDWTATVEAETLSLATLGAFGPRELGYAGSLSLRADLAGGDGAVTGAARLDLTRGSVEGPVDGERRTLLAWAPGEVEATLAPDRVDARLALPLVDGGRLAASVGLERAPGRGLSGRFQAEIDDLSLVSALVPQIGGVAGRLVADIGLSGTLDDPRLSGSAALQEGRVSVIPLGIDVTDIGLDLATLGSGFRVDLTGHSGEGPLNAVIELRRGAKGDWLGEGRINGAGFVTADTPELELAVSPALRWRVEDREIRLDGRLELPRARIEPRDLSGTTQPSPDTVIVRENGEIESVNGPGWKIFADVEVVLGDDVRIDAFGLDGRLGGAIRVRERPDRLTSASGELRVEEGSYSIYRQTLEIQRGRVLFDGGPIADPGLDVRAVRRPRDVLVGVNVRGTLREPRVTLFSEPPMQQSQQLSYLIAGVPLNESSGGDRNAMAAAAAALATSEQGRAIAGKLGIDEVTVDQGRETNEGASLVLGRYLSPRLYVGYGIGLAEQANSVRMRYELTRRWSVEARSGSTQSADLLYSIETNGEPGE